MVFVEFLAKKLPALMCNTLHYHAQ